MLAMGRPAYVCTVQCKEKVTIVSRQVREPSHNSLLPIFHEALKPLWKFTKPFTVDYLYKHH